MDEVLRRLDASQRILVLAHERPDGDAFGSVYGTVLTLRAAGKTVAGVTERPLPARYRSIFPALPQVSQYLPAGSWDCVLCLDTSNPERVSPAEGLQVAGATVCNVDHHADNRRYGHLNWVEPSASATAEMLAHLFDQAPFCLAPDAASCLLAGMLMDTGGLRFPNTSPTCLRTVASLIEQGADYATLSDALFFREPWERRRLEAHLVETATPVFNGQLLYAVLHPDEAQRRGLDRADLEGLIDVLRSVAGVRIACLVQPENENVRVSLRARAPDAPVDTIARALGGGGHPLAAGATIENASSEEAVRTILTSAEEVLNHGDRPG